MPVVVGLPIIIEALFLLGLAYASLIVLRPFLASMADAIPFIGGYIRRALDSVIGLIVNAWNDWVGSHIASVIHWFSGLASAIADLPDAIADFATHTVTTLDILWHHRIPALIDASLRQLRATVGTMDAAITGIGHDITGLGNRITHEVKDLRDWATAEILQRALNGIDRLRRDVFTDAIPALASGIGTRIGALEKTVGSAFDYAGSIARDLAQLKDRIAGSLPWVETVAATIGAAAAIEALRRVVRCGSKIDKLCTTDENILGDLLGTLLVIGAFDGLEAFTREAATVLDASIGAVKSLAD